MLEENRFANVLASLRARRGWTQKDAAAHIEEVGEGLNLRTYIKVETGQLPPSEKHLKLIAAGFKLNQADTDALYYVAHHGSPRKHNLPFPQNLLFTGREAHLERLDQLLMENYSVALTGLAGIGKTQIALEYAYRCYLAKDYQSVFWVSAADEESLRTGYTALAEKLGLPVRDGREQAKLVDAVKEWLARHTNWLLIMDNADDLQLARSFFPEVHEDNHGHILLTTRCQQVGNIARKIDIDKMKPEEGLLFLLRRSNVLEVTTKHATVIPADIRNAAAQVVELLDAHPLALDQAGAYIQDGGSFTEYITLYHGKCRELLSKRGSLDEENEGKYSEYPDSVAVTFELCFEKARNRCLLATDILRFCAFLHPDDIPDELLQHEESFKRDATEFEKGRRALLRYSLLKRNSQEQTFSMHRLVQAVLIDEMPPDLQKQWRELIVQALMAAFPDERNYSMEWVKCSRLLRHIIAYAAWIKPELDASLDTTRLFYKVYRYLVDRLNYEDARTLLTTVLSIYMQRLGAAHPDTVSTLIDLGSVYSLQKKYDLAESSYLRAIAILEKHYEPEHKLIITSLILLAYPCIDQGKCEQAELLIERVISIQEKTPEPDLIRGISDAVLYLAYNYEALRKYEQAEAWFKRALTILEQGLGVIDPSTQITREYFARFLERTGRGQKPQR